jgi:hypothetical protein
VTAWTTGAAILEQSGAAPGSPADVAWADLCAAAVNAGLDVRLTGAVLLEPLPAELERVALQAGVTAYKAREANADASAPAGIVGDYLDTHEGVIARWATVGIA